MQKSRNNEPIEVGDYVRCLFLGSPEYNQTGLVIDRIHYDQPETTHPDAYSCRVLFSGGEKMIRAKWLSVLSKIGEKE